MAGQGTEVTASLLEVGGYCSCTMRPGVVIHIHRPCSQWVVVEIGDNNWLQDISHVLITSWIALYGDQIQLAVMRDTPPNHY